MLIRTRRALDERTPRVRSQSARQFAQPGTRCALRDHFLKEPRNVHEAIPAPFGMGTFTRYPVICPPGISGHLLSQFPRIKYPLILFYISFRKYSVFTRWVWFAQIANRIRHRKHESKVFGSALADPSLVGLVVLSLVGLVVPLVVMMTSDRILFRSGSKLRRKLLNVFTTPRRA